MQLGKEMKFMKIWKLSMIAMAVMLVMTLATFSPGAVSSEEAAKLGTTLTRFGAEMAGNKDGTIPPYTGGLPTPPATYKAGSGRYTDPFVAEKPLLSINAQNMAQYADKLSPGTTALMKRFPTYRIDIYKTQRTMAYPDYVIKNTLKNAVTAKTTNGGLCLTGAHGGIAFPIPKDGYETMWNHHTRYYGLGYFNRCYGYVVDSNGRIINTQAIDQTEEMPYYNPDPTVPDADIFWKTKVHWWGPPRKSGEGLVLFDPVDMIGKGRIAYQYLPGQRRVKLAPEVGFDTPASHSSGNGVYDENYIFNGSMERYDMKLIGKKEMYVPYNTYKASYMVEKEELFGPKHLNPDVIRWELHRVWVVEATVKPEKRHIYKRRTLYLDEDSWTALASENYDAAGRLFKVNFCHQAPRYDVPCGAAQFFVQYNMMTGNYYGDAWIGKSGWIRTQAPKPQSFWSPATLAGQSIR
jgi:hypothetical protein